MKAAPAYPKVASVEPLEGKRLRVEFRNGDKRIYDCTPLLKDKAFSALTQDSLFRTVRSDPHGYAVIWNDAIDLAESELWLHGKPA